MPKRQGNNEAHIRTRAATTTGAIHRYDNPKIRAELLPSILCIPTAKILLGSSKFEDREKQSVSYAGWIDIPRTYIQKKMLQVSRRVRGTGTTSGANCLFEQISRTHFQLYPTGGSVDP